MKARLVLVRHGESIWNQQNRFTGWVDVALSRRGMAEAEQAGQLLADEHFDVAFTSALLRAQDTLYEILKQNSHCQQYVRIHELSSTWYEHFNALHDDLRELKIYVSEKLNERYYGDLQGMNKNKAKQEYGPEKVQRWRRSYDDPPPHGESLAMTAERTLPYYHQYISAYLQKGAHVLVSAHGNSLRSIIMHIEQMTTQQIINYEISTGKPHIYDFDVQGRLIDKFIMGGT